MPSYHILADLRPEDDGGDEAWGKVSSRRKAKPAPAPAPVAPTKRTISAGTGHGGRSPGEHDSQRPHAAREHAPTTPRNTHDDTGKPVTEDYYRAFQKCFRDASGDVVLKFHKTNVVTVKPNGDVQLYTNNYFTYTTLCSINDALQFIDLKLSVKGDVKDPDNWVVTLTGGPSQGFHDNMTLKARHAEDRSRGEEVLMGMRALLESTDISIEHHSRDRKQAPQPRAPLRMFSNGGSGGNNTPEPPAPPAPPPTIVPVNPAPPPPTFAKGSAWAASGSLAARLAADTPARNPSGAPAGGDFPLLAGTSPATGPPATAVAAAAAPVARTSGSGAAAAPARAAPAAAAAARAAAPQQQPAPPAAAAAANKRHQHAPYYASAVVVSDNGEVNEPQLQAPPPPPQVATPPRRAAPGPVAPPATTPNGGFSALPDSLDEVFASAPVGLGARGGPGSLTAAPMYAPAPAPAPAYENNVNSFFSNAAMSGKNSAVSELYSQHAAGWANGPAGDDDDTKCVVCMHYKADTILIPCSHAILCRGCADHVVNLTPGSTGECPVCRTPVDLVLDVS